MTHPKRPRKPLTPAQLREADALREKIKALDQFHYKASASRCRRKLRALLGGYDLE